MRDSRECQPGSDYLHRSMLDLIRSDQGGWFTLRDRVRLVVGDRTWEIRFCNLMSDEWHLETLKDERITYKTFSSFLIFMGHTFAVWQPGVGCGCLGKRKEGCGRVQSI